MGVEDDGSGVSHSFVHFISEGARRIGKSTICEEFGKNEYEKIHILMQQLEEKDFIKMSANLQLFQSYMKNQLTPVCKAFIEYLQARLKAHKSVKEFIDLQNLEQECVGMTAAFPL